MMQILNWSILILVFLQNYYFGKVNSYLAMTDMEDLLETEKAMIDGLQQYIKFEENKLLELKSKINDFQKGYTEARNSSNLFLLNPINAYLFTKHLTTDWRDVEGLMNDDEGGKIIKSVVNKSSSLRFPTVDDLNGAATALIRLQNVYNLNAQDVAKGLLNGIKFNKELSATDCFQIGKSAYNDQNYKRTIHWMQVALEKLSSLQDSNKSLIPLVTKLEILGYLSFSIYNEGDVKTALKLSKEMLELNPEDEIANNNIPHYEKEIKELKPNETDSNATSSGPSKDFSKMNLMEKYQILCRGEEKPLPSEERNLRCLYIHNNNPFLKIGPIKCEQILLNPVILIFHDVLYDSEIDRIKKLARPKLDRAAVFDSKAPRIRISKTSWLHHSDDVVVSNVIRRSGLMTRLNVGSAEPLQICNYGIGGHYEPHVDYNDDPKAFEADRTATILFYMTDVQQGGATVFTELKRTVYPEKGSAVFWYNLLSNGQGNPKTRHAACPVLTGTKWVANLWLHETGQICHTP